MARRGRKSRGRKIGSKSPKVELTQEEEALVRFVNLKIDPENVSDVVRCLLNVSGGDWRHLGGVEETSPPFWAELNLEGQKISVNTLKGYQKTIKDYFRRCRGRHNPQVPNTVQRSISEKLSKCQVRYDFETGQWMPAILTQEDMHNIRIEDIMKRAGELAVRKLLAGQKRKIPVPPQQASTKQAFDLAVQTAPTVARFLTNRSVYLHRCPRCRLIFLSRQYNAKYCSKRCTQASWQLKRAKEGYHAKWIRERRDSNSPKFDIKVVQENVNMEKLA